MSAIAAVPRATDTPEEAAFRAQVRRFAEENCPADIKAIVASGGKITKREWRAWQLILFQHGWGAPGWPVEYGGTGWNIKQRLIFEEEMSAANCPPLYHHGLGHIGPVIIRFGNEAQKKHWLPRILDGTDWWCQGYSEPNAGSDLASLRTSARLDGDHYVVNGQKMWTSHATEASMMYMLVRTSKEARKQDGISLLLVPMDTPGITVRPTHTIDEWHHVNEVFFDEVRVPRVNLVGEEGRGWQCGKYLLERERLPAASVARMEALWRQVAALLERRVHDIPARNLDRLRYQLLLAEANLSGAREMLASATDDLIHQRPLGGKPSALKLQTSETSQDLTAIALELVGPAQAMRFVPAEGAEDDDAVWVHNYLYYRSKTIAGGTSEVQRNVIARELFGG